MVPFCNRVEGNRFSFAGEDYQLESNTDWDPLYLHGEGWISPWLLEERTDTSVVMSLSHSPKKGAPYGYWAVQEISVEGEVLTLRITMGNDLEHLQLFGMGHHLFFPKTPGTRLRAKARGFWTEKESYLPDKRIPVEGEIDFSHPSIIPDHWINNGFDGWDGTAEILWPERNMGVTLEGDEHYGDYFIFHSDRNFEPDFKGDYFCFEPMTHTANGHKMPPLYGGLIPLDQGESFETVLKIKPWRR